MDQPAVSIWANVNEGCPITCTVSGSDQAHLMIASRVELDFDVESMRVLVSTVTGALAEMDARYAREAAEESLQDNTKAAVRT